MNGSCDRSRWRRRSVASSNPSPRSVGGAQPAADLPHRGRSSGWTGAWCQHLGKVRLQLFRPPVPVIASVVAAVCLGLFQLQTVTASRELFDVRMAVEVLTRPDNGPAGRTVRWAGPTVTYRITLGAYPPDFVDEVRTALSWASAVTGLDLQEVAGPAQLEVVQKDGNGAFTSGTLGEDWSLTSVRVELGCCRVRPVWEDVLQAFGPFGDRADGRSIFSQSRTRDLPSDFDAWLLRALYQVPEGSSPGEVSEALRRIMPPDR